MSELSPPILFNTFERVDFCMSPLVSVIIPSYNRENYIAETIESVLNQTYDNIELIVVDDGSTDKSRNIIDSYGDKISILEHPGRINKGQSAALNLGISISQGEYIAFLDSDDLFAPDKIDKQVRFLEENSQYGLVYGNGDAIDENGEILYRLYENDHYEKSDPNLILLDCYFLLPNNSLLRKDVLASAGLFDESLRAAQDHDLLVRVAEVTKVAYINECLFFYRRHKDSISQRSAKLRWKNGYKILRKSQLRYPYRLSTLLGRLAVLNFRLGQCYKRDGKLFQAFSLFLAAGICDPIRAIKVLMRREIS